MSLSRKLAPNGALIGTINMDLGLEAAVRCVVILHPSDAKGKIHGACVTPPSAASPLATQHQVDLLHRFNVCRTQCEEDI